MNSILILASADQPLIYIYASLSTAIQLGEHPNIATYEEKTLKALHIQYICSQTDHPLINPMNLIYVSIRFSSS